MSFSFPHVMLHASILLSTRSKERYPSQSCEDFAPFFGAFSMFFFISNIHILQESIKYFQSAGELFGALPHGPADCVTGYWGNLLGQFFLKFWGFQILGSVWCFCIPEVLFLIERILPKNFRGWILIFNRAQHAVVFYNLCICTPDDQTYLNDFFQKRKYMYG